MIVKYPYNHTAFHLTKPLLHIAKRYAFLSIIIEQAQTLCAGMLV